MKVKRESKVTALLAVNLSTKTEVHDQLHTLATLLARKELQYPLQRRVVWMGMKNRKLLSPTII